VAFAVFDDRVGAARGPALAAWAVGAFLSCALVDLQPFVARRAGAVDGDERILATVLDQNRHAAAGRTGDGERSAADRRDGGDAIRHRAAEQSAEERTVGETSGEDTGAVDAIAALEIVEQSANEGEVAIAVDGVHLPAGAFLLDAADVQTDGQAFRLDRD